MKRVPLRHTVFWALCCCMGLFCKRLISPATNIITEALHIPGGIGTSFSLMFILVAAMLVPHPKCCTIMSIVQSALALGMGMVGSMGVLSPIGYILPGVMMDLMIAMARKANLSQADTMVLANAAGAVCAALTANWIVFRLRGPVLLLYCSVAATSGGIFGLLGGKMVKRAKPAICSAALGSKEIEYEKE